MPLTYPLQAKTFHGNRDTMVTVACTGRVLYLEGLLYTYLKDRARENMAELL